MKLIEFKELGLELFLTKKIHCIMSSDYNTKTLFLNKLVNKIDNNEIFIDGESIKNYDVSFLKKNIMTVFNDEEYNNEIVIQELSYYLGILDFSIKEIDKYINEIVNYFNIKSILNSRIDSLRTDKRILVKILSFLIAKPKVIAIDNLFMYMDVTDVEKILNYSKKNNICIINVTSDSEFILRADYTHILNNGKCLLSGNPTEILEGNTIFPYIGIKLPFITELSQNLILYNLINKNYYDNRKLVDKLWK